METKDINDLQANPNNPRTISKDDFAALRESIKRFGDLSGIVFNNQTNQLVGGHQRTEAFKRIGHGASIVIMEKLTEPDKYGTVATGYVLIDGSKHSYREVFWSPNWELSANIAANRISGDFDLELLAQANYELAQDPNASELLALTGQSEAEIKRLLGSTGATDDETEPAAPRSILEVDCILDETMHALRKELGDRGFVCTIGK